MHIYPGKAGKLCRKILMNNFFAVINYIDPVASIVWKAGLQGVDRPDSIRRKGWSITAVVTKLTFQKDMKLYSSIRIA